MAGDEDARALEVEEELRAHRKRLLMPAAQRAFAAYGFEISIDHLADQLRRT